MATPTEIASVDKKFMNSPDEIHKFDKCKLELTTFKNGATIERIMLEPGWSWDIDFAGLKDYAKEGGLQVQA